MPLPLAEIAPAIEPTIVTSSPSRIQTVPKPIRILQCQRDHGSRSSAPDIGLDRAELFAWGYRGCHRRILLRSLATRAATPSTPATHILSE